MTSTVLRVGAANHEKGMRRAQIIPASQERRGVLSSFFVKRT
jgi:hypothetical protein